MPELLGGREIALLQPWQKQMNISHTACIWEGLLSFIDVPGYLKDSNSAPHSVDSDITKLFIYVPVPRLTLTFIS